MTTPFQYFAIFAEMRTGSNFLEENINEYPGLKSYGEVFNPHFVGHARQTELLGLSLADRERDPIAFLDNLRDRAEGMPGFRFFHDHDPRVLDHILRDRGCAKIILTRNALESYVSLKIAGATGQWRLGDMRHAKSAKAAFDIREFERYLADRQAFQLRLMRALQASGQTAFYVDYEDIQEIDVLNGLARYLGVNEEKRSLSTATKKQNPAPLEEKLVNFNEMAEQLSRIDAFGLGRTPNFEPRRAPVVPNYVAGTEAPLLFMPVRGAPQAEIIAWLAALDKVDEADLVSGFTQKTLRHWKRHHSGHRGFTVVCHPVERAYATFQRHILMPGPECYADIRKTLRSTYNIPLPEGAPDESYNRLAHHDAFLAFLRFLKGNLAGQTSVRVDGAWASQEAVLQGFGAFALPDMILRKESLAEGLAQLCAQIGRTPAPLPSPKPIGPFALGDVYDDEIEAAARQAYQRDYMVFGYGPWQPDQAA